jgi:uncharacterized membrane protein YfcA
VTADWLIYPPLGVIAGLLAGLLGVGGGIVVVPALVFAYSHAGFPPDVLMHMAVATSLATILLTSTGSIYQHHSAGAVNWRLVAILSVGLCVGALFGARLADAMKGQWLQWLFGGFTFLIAAQLLFGVEPRPSRDLPGESALACAGGLIGVASAVFGIGGGSLTVPYLVWHNVRMQEAVGTSAACGFAIAIAGAAGFMLAGEGNERLPEGSLGYVYLPAVAGIGVTSVFFARIGARFAHRLPAATLKKLFACLLVLVGTKLLAG